MTENLKYDDQIYNYNKKVRARGGFWAQIYENPPNLAKNPPKHPFFE